MPGIEENTAEILRYVLDEWRAGIAAHDPQRVAAVFTEDAIFQGLTPTASADGEYPTITRRNPSA